MLRRPQALALTLALLAAPAAGAAEEPLPGSTAPVEKPRKQQESQLQLRALGGAFDGLGVRRESGGVALFEADWKPTLSSDASSVAFPLRFDHRQTFGASLNETTAGAGVDVDFRSGDVTTGPVAGAAYTWRPDWPDLYQPDGRGGLLTTDRYSHSRWFAAWQLWDKLGDGKHLRLKVQYARTNYKQDPNYDPAASIVHLAPRDNGEASFTGSFRKLTGAFAVAVRLQAFRRSYDELLAKKADTGGTSRSDPKQVLYGAEPRLEGELKTKPVQITVGYGLLLQHDPFQGYYSYTGHHPYVQARLSPTRDLSLDASLSAKLLTYGPNSKSISKVSTGVYDQGTEDGKRLRDDELEVKAAARYRLVGGLSVVAEGSWKKRDTNYRDYVPGVYPPTATRPYDIRWDYTNVMITGGVEWAL